MIKDEIVKGAHNASHRSLYHALGLTAEELDRPLIGVVSSYNEIVPGHMNLDKITEAVKMGVAMAGGTPIMFPAIAVCDGIAMGHRGMKYSLVTRDLIADSTEAMVLAHGFDGLVMIPNCDKNVPGLLMAYSCRAAPCLPAAWTVTRPAFRECSRRWVPSWRVKFPKKSFSNMNVRPVPPAAPARVCIRPIP